MLREERVEWIVRVQIPRVFTWHQDCVKQVACRTGNETVHSHTSQCCGNFSAHLQLLHMQPTRLAGIAFIGVQLPAPSYSTSRLADTNFWISTSTAATRDTTSGPRRIPNGPNA